MFAVLQKRAVGIGKHYSVRKGRRHITQCPGWQVESSEWDSGECQVRMLAIEQHVWITGLGLAGCGVGEGEKVQVAASVYVLMCK